MPKLTLQVTPEMDAILEELASNRDIPKAQLIRRAVLMMKFLDSEDKEISVTDKRTGRTSTLVFESQMDTQIAGRTDTASAANVASTSGSE